MCMESSIFFMSRTGDPPENFWKEEGGENHLFFQGGYQAYSFPKASFLASKVSLIPSNCSIVPCFLVMLIKSPLDQLLSKSLIAQIKVSPSFLFSNSSFGSFSLSSLESASSAELVLSIWYFSTTFSVIFLLWKTSTAASSAFGRFSLAFQCLSWRSQYKGFVFYQTVTERGGGWGKPSPTFKVTDASLWKIYMGQV